MTRARPDISVVIAAWNAQGCVGHAMASALGQEKVSVEVIVVDDASTDKTAKTAASFCRPTDRVLTVDQNGGPAAARNRGFRVARGRWIAVLDADDTFLDGRLARMRDIGERHRADLVVDDLLATAPEGTGARPFFGRRLRRLDRLDLWDLLSSDAVFSSRPGFGYMKPLFRRDFLERNGLRYDHSLRIGEDFALLADCLAVGAVARVDPTPGYRYARRAGSASHRLTIADIDAIREADMRFASRWPLEGAAAAAVARRLRALDDAEAFVAAVEALKAGKWLRATAALGRRPGALPIFRYPIGARIARLWARKQRHEA